MMNDKGIGFWVHIAIQFLLRSGRSTAALSVMVITAVSALIFLSALAVGVNDAMLQNSVGLFSGHITGTGLPVSFDPEKLRAEGVAGVLKRIYLPGVLSNGRLDQPLTLCGVDAEREIVLTALEKKTVSGRYLQGNKSELFISKALADELGVTIGSVLQFSASDRESSPGLTVCGIYRTRIDQLDRGIAFCPRNLLQGNDAFCSAAIFLERGVDPQRIIEVYTQKWPGSYRFESWTTMMPDLRQLIDLQYVSMGIVIILIFGVVSVGIACIFVIFIIKNLREYGIMKAMGVTTREMSFLIVMKVALMNAVACGVGLFIGVLAVWWVAGAGGIDITAWTSHNRYFSVSGIISPRLTVFSLFAPPAAAFFFSLMAAVWPAALVAGKKAADIIRMI